MSILIKGVDLPKGGWYLDLVITADGVVRDYGDEDEQIAEAVELPDHGDLIDKDKFYIDLMDRGVDYVQTDDYTEICQAVCNAPVVIPAERREDGET